MSTVLVGMIKTSVYIYNKKYTNKYDKEWLYYKYTIQEA